MARVGHNMRLVMEAAEELGAERGRPPTRRELAEMLALMSSPALSRALSALVSAGYFDAGDGTNPVQVRTLDGKRVVWRREVVDE